MYIYIYIKGLMACSSIQASTARSDHLCLTSSRSESLNKPARIQGKKIGVSLSSRLGGHKEE